MNALASSFDGSFESLQVIDAHTGGEPLRIVIGGLPPLPGRTILEKRSFMRAHLDHLRTALVFEPRGHADMYACVLTEPTTPDGDLGVIFLHNEGYSTMCGHAIIALTKVVLEERLFDLEGPSLRLDTPAGRVFATARIEGSRVRSVAFRNVPSFALARDLEIELPGLGLLRHDIAFGGAFYAFCEAAPLGLELVPQAAAKLIAIGRQITSAVAERERITHPGEKDLSFLYGTIFTGPPAHPTHHSRHVCIFADGQLDRSATGTGVSARIALLYGSGQAQLGETLVIESILGTTMEVRALEKTQIGEHPGVVPEVSGSAHICGRSELVIDPDDPLRAGFLLR